MTVELEDIAAEIIERLGTLCGMPPEEAVKRAVYAAYSDYAEAIVAERHNALLREIGFPANGSILPTSTEPPTTLDGTPPTPADSAPSEAPDGAASVPPPPERHPRRVRRHRQTADPKRDKLLAGAKALGMPKSSQYGLSIIVPTVAEWAAAYAEIATRVAEIASKDGPIPKGHPYPHHQARLVAVQLHCEENNMDMNAMHWLPDLRHLRAAPPDWDTFIEFLESTHAFPALRFRKFCSLAQWHHPIYVSWRLHAEEGEEGAHPTA